MSAKGIRQVGGSPRFIKRFDLNSRKIKHSFCAGFQGLINIVWKNGSELERSFHLRPEDRGLPKGGGSAWVEFAHSASLYGSFRYFFAVSGFTLCNFAALA